MRSDSLYRSTGVTQTQLNKLANARSPEDIKNALKISIWQSIKNFFLGKDHNKAIGHLSDIIFSGSEITKNPASHSDLKSKDKNVLSYKSFENTMFSTMKLCKLSNKGFDFLKLEVNKDNQSNDILQVDITLGDKKIGKEVNKQDLLNHFEELSGICNFQAKTPVQNFIKNEVLSDLNDYKPIDEKTLKAIKLLVITPIHYKIRCRI